MTRAGKFLKEKNKEEETVFSCHNALDTSQSVTLQRAAAIATWYLGKARQVRAALLL